MDKDTLMNQIEFAWARIEELEGTLEHADPEGKGYNGLIDAYVKWVDRYNNLVEKLNRMEDVEEDKEDKLSKKEIIDVILRSAELGAKVLIPVVGLVGTVAIAKLAYANDADLKLCNGRIFGSVREVLKLATMRL